MKTRYFIASSFCAVLLIGFVTLFNSSSQDLPSTAKASMTDAVQAISTQNTSLDASSKSSQAGTQEVGISSNTSTNSDNKQSSSNTSVKVNGKTIQVPANGEVHKTIKSGDSTTNLDVSHESTTNGSAGNTNNLLKLKVNLR